MATHKLNKRYSWPDVGWFALAASYLREEASVNAYFGSGGSGDAARIFTNQNLNFAGEFVVVRARDLVIYRVPSSKIETVRGRLS